MNAQATFETQSAARYLGTLCKHFARKLPVACEDHAGRIEFPFGLCKLRASHSALELYIQADTQSDLERTASIISSHLERFAFRENPAIDWSVAPFGGAPGP